MAIVCRHGDPPMRSRHLRDRPRAPSRYASLRQQPPALSVPASKLICVRSANSRCDNPLTPVLLDNLLNLSRAWSSCHDASLSAEDDTRQEGLVGPLQNTSGRGGMEAIDMSDNAGSASSLPLETVTSVASLFSLDGIRGWGATITA
jgi:hypothetical protein